MPSPQGATSTSETTDPAPFPRHPTDGANMPSNEPETIYASQLGKTKAEQLGETNKCGDENVEYIPRDCGYGNKLGGAPLGPSNLGAGGTSDLRLLRRAIRERWPLTDEQREKLPLWLVKIVGDEDLDVRGRVGAAKVIVEMDKLNMAQEQADAGGAKVNIDVTSGGKPLQATEYAKLSTEQLEELLKQREIGG